MLRFLALLALALLPASPLRACTAAEGYRVPTNFELVRKADLILLARVVSGAHDITDARSEVLIEPVRVLKGTVPAVPLTLVGAVRWNGRDMHPAPTSLGNPHFSTGLGSCIRVFYPQGGLVLAMFGKDPEGGAGMVQLFEPWARVVEDVEGPDGIWVKAVETYLELLAAAPGEKLRPAIAARRDVLLARKDDLAARAIGNDLDDHLRTTGPQPPPSQGARWRLVDGPLDAGALLATGSKGPILFYCRSGSRSLHAKLFGRPGGQIELAAGDRIFAAEGETVTIEKIGDESVRVLAGTIPLTEPLLSALQRNAADTGVRIDGRPQAAAPPFDVLQKLALRCSDFLRGQPDPRSARVTNPL